jgi:hypothetical protein
MRADQSVVELDADGAAGLDVVDGADVPDESDLLVPPLSPPFALVAGFASVLLSLLLSAGAESAAAPLLFGA